jgi:ankyrin repeat protein
MVQTLLAMGVNAHADPRSCALLAKAVDMDARIVHAVITAGLDVNCYLGAQHVTPLMAAAGVNRAEASLWVAMGQARNPHPDPVAAAKLLMQAGAHVNATDVWGRTALRWTIAPNNVDVARVLLDAGADVNNTIGDATSIGVQRGNTALLEAIAWYPLRWDPTLVKLLLRRGADVNYRNHRAYDEDCDTTTRGQCTFAGQTALTRTAADGYYTIVKLLLEHGADPTLSRADGKEPAAIARANGHDHTAVLIEKYAKVGTQEQRSDNGRK